MVRSLALPQPNQRLALVHRGGRTWVHALPFLLGRSDRCELILAGPSVSRRHARITGGDGSFLIEDLESSNGLFLNGAQVFDPVALRIGDEIALGDETVYVTALDGAGDAGISGIRAKYLLLGREPQRVAPGSAPTDLVRALGAVDAALLSSHEKDAEHVFAACLAGPIEEQARAGALDAGTAERVGLLAVRLADSTGNSAWFDFVVRVYTHTGADMSPMLVSGLYALARRLGGVNRSCLNAYAARLRARGTELSPARRLLLDRLEGLSGSSHRRCSAAGST